MKSKRRARRKSKQRSAERPASAPPQPAFTEIEEAFFAAGVAASESGRFEGLAEEPDAPRPGLLRRFLLRVQRA